MYYTYFIISETAQIVYVGTSCAKDKLAILRKHLRGEVVSTKEIFGPGQNRVIPYIHICAEKHFDCNNAQVDAKYWVGYLSRQGYQVIGSEMVPNALMKSVRAEIALKDTVGRTLQEVLAAEGTQNLYSATHGDERKTLRHKYTVYAKDTVLNIRTKSEVAQAFRTLAVQMDATQSQTLGALLDAYSGVSKFEVEDLLERLQKAQERYDELEKELFEYMIDRDRQEKRLKEKISVLKTMAYEATSKWPYRNIRDGRKIPIYTRKQAKRIFSERRSYLPPENAGTRLIQVDCIVYGRCSANRRQAVFIYGTTLDGAEKIRLRWYPRKDYVGRIPTMDIYHNTAFVWQVGFVKAPDGAMDMIGGIPLRPEWLIDKPKHPWEKQEPAIKLSELLQWHQGRYGEYKLEDFLMEQLQKEKASWISEQQQKAAFAYIDGSKEKNATDNGTIIKKEESSGFERLIKDAQDRAGKK